MITHYNANTWERVPLTTTGTRQLKLPAGFKLQPVSPNPFRSGTTIRFELNHRMVARLDVYDSTGSLAANLLNEEKEPGSYFISWDGKNTSGQQLPGGVYYIRLEANNAVQTQKVILAR